MHIHTYTHSYTDRVVYQQEAIIAAFSLCVRSEAIIISLSYRFSIDLPFNSKGSLFPHLPPFFEWLMVKAFFDVLFLSHLDKNTFGVVLHTRATCQCLFTVPSLPPPYWQHSIEKPMMMTHCVKASIPGQYLCGGEPNVRLTAGPLGVLSEPRGDPFPLPALPGRDREEKKTLLQHKEGTLSNTLSFCAHWFINYHTSRMERHYLLTR